MTYCVFNTNTREIALLCGDSERTIAEKVAATLRRNEKDDGWTLWALVEIDDHKGDRTDD